MNKRKGYIFLLTMLFFANIMMTNGQTVTLEGVVLDSMTMQPLPYATVAVKDNPMGTAAGIEGRFIMEVPVTFSDSTFLCSYMGYKTFEAKVSEFRPGDTILLVKEPISLEEVTVTPNTPWDYVWNAMRSIPENYASQPYMSTGYYSEYISENDVYLKFTEAVVESWCPAYAGKEKIRTKVLKARSIDNPGQISFKRKKIEKSYAKEKKKTLKKGKTWEGEDNIDAEIVSSTFGGPELILEKDPLRDIASFLNINEHKQYTYSIAGYTSQYGQKVIIIGFNAKGVYEHKKANGKIYISLESNAIIAIDYHAQIKVPVLLKPVLFVMGIGVKNPEIRSQIHYRPVKYKWFLNDFSIDGSVLLIDKKIFRKNEKSDFKLHISLVNEKFDFENVTKIPDDERIDTNKPLEEQVEPDPEFWKNYNVARPVEIRQ